MPLGAFGPVVAPLAPMFIRTRSALSGHYRVTEEKRRSAFESGAQGCHSRILADPGGSSAEGASASGTWNENRLSRFEPDSANSYSHNECDAGGRWAYVCTSPKAPPDGIVPDPYA